MTADPNVQRDFETVRQIVHLAVGDAVEILVLVELLETQNRPQVISRLSISGAGQSAIVVRNSLFARLTTLVSRAYAKPRPGDLHLRHAFELIAGSEALRTKVHKTTSAGDLAAAETHYKHCRGDKRLAQISHFRDKYTVHLGEPKDIARPMISALFEFANQTVLVIQKLAFSIGLETRPLKSQVDACSVEAFWKPWMSAT
jgi:hypothetical protein